jgi:hypothetical protein
LKVKRSLTLYMDCGVVSGRDAADLTFRSHAPRIKKKGGNP